MVTRVALLLLAFLAPAAAGGQGGAAVTLQSDATVSGARVSLSDVADLDALRRVDPALAARLAGVSLATVPANAELLHLKVRDVLGRIRHASAGAVGKVAIDRGIDRIRVTARQEPVPASVLVDAAVEHFLAECSAVARQCRVDADMVRVAATRIPSGRLELRPMLPARWIDRGTETAARVGLVVDGVQVGAVSVPLKWHAQREAWRLAAGVDRGGALRRKDVRAVYVDAHELAATGQGLWYDAFTRVVKARTELGVGAFVPAAGGDVLAIHRKGDPVAVQMRLGNVQVVRTGEAIEDARAGHRSFVRFEGEDLVSARVRDAGSEEDEVNAQGSGR